MSSEISHHEQINSILFISTVMYTEILQVDIPIGILHKINLNILLIISPQLWISYFPPIFKGCLQVLTIQ